MKSDRRLQPGPRLLASVIVSAVVGAAVGIPAAWALYSHLGPAREIVGSPHDAGSGATLNDIEAKTLASVVTIATQPINGDITANASTLVSGFVVSSDGLVVTSLAAIHGATQLHAGLADGRTFSATVAAVDVLHGIAVLRLANAGGLTPIAFASSAPTLGEVAVAVGRPPFLSPTIRAGAVSAEAYQLPNANASQPMIDGVIVVDANPISGGEGSPLLDANGNVIGVVTAPSPAPTPGLFALSGTAAARLVSTVQQGATVVAVDVGFSAIDLHPATAAAINMPSGALVTAVNAGSPADQAGLQIGDVITAANGSPITPSHTWSDTLSGLVVDQQLSLTVARSGATLTVAFQLPPL